MRLSVDKIKMSNCGLRDSGLNRFIRIVFVVRLTRKKGVGSAGRIGLSFGRITETTSML